MSGAGERLIKSALKARDIASAMKYTARLDSFTNKWVMEDDKGKHLASFPACEGELVRKIVTSLNDKGLDVT